MHQKGKKNNDTYMQYGHRYRYWCEMISVFIGIVPYFSNNHHCIMCKMSAMSRKVIYLHTYVCMQHRTSFNGVECNEVHTYVHLIACMCLHTYIRTYIHTYVHMYIYIYIYIRTHFCW